MSDRIPILFTIPNFITAGSGRAMLNIVERLDPDRFAPAVGVLRSGGRLDDEVRRLGIPFLEAPFCVAARPYSTLLQRAHRAAEPFRQYRFKLWHSFHYAGDYTEPIIARFAGAAWVYTKKNMNWYRRAWYLRSLFARRIAVQNRDMLGDFFRKFPLNRKARLIPRGVNTNRFAPNVPKRLQLRNELNIAPETTIVGCVAHLLPVKGQGTLIQSIAPLPHLHLLLAGRPLDEEYAVYLRHLARELGIEQRVTFLGEVHDVPALLAELDLFVLPTWAKWRAEGCPVALLEAMACAKACVATDVPGSRDLIEHEKDGWLVPPEEPESLSAALNRLSASPDLRQRLGISARTQVLEHYTIEHEVAAHQSLYSELLS